MFEVWTYLRHLIELTIFYNKVFIDFICLLISEFNCVVNIDTVLIIACVLLKKRRKKY